MGLKSFSGDFPVLKFLNNIVSGYFDFSEIQAMRHNPMYMSDYVEHLEYMIKLKRGFDRPV